MSYARAWTLTFELLIGWSLRFLPRVDPCAFRRGKLPGYWQIQLPDVRGASAGP